MPGPRMTEQEAIAFMQKTSSTDGGSLYDHITDVVMKVSSYCTQRNLLHSIFAIATGVLHS